MAYHLWEKLSKKDLFFIIGPCVIESRDLLEQVGSELKRLGDKLSIEIVFKSSFTKANRTSIHSFTGIEPSLALQYLSDVSDENTLPCTTDIHNDDDAAFAAAYVDILQIPAFLCRQTSLLTAAAKTNRIVNVKKGQFLSPEAMKYVVEKLKHAGNEKIILTERGNSFGYGDLVVDMRSIPIMQSLGVSVVLDVTHSVQKPNQAAGITSGTPQYIETLAKAGVAAGVNGIFIETHPEPSKALSDGSNMLPLDKLEPLIIKLLKIHQSL